MTKILQAAELLPHGRVRAVEASPVGATNAHLFALRASYEDTGLAMGPKRFLLKLVDLEDTDFGPSEVDYLTRDYVDLLDAPIPRTYDAAYSAESRRYHVLMENLSEGFRPGWEVTPTREYGESCAEALAILHAHRWTLAQRWSIGAALPGSGQLDRYLSHVQPGIEPMLTAGRCAIPAEWESLIRLLAREHPKLLQKRLKRPDGFTVVHGDVNPGNILSPKHGSKPTYLIDRQPFSWSLATWLGVADVAYMMVHWWDTAVRRQLEMPVLAAYQRTLLDRGIEDYSWEQLLLDYRLTTVQSLDVAAAWCVDPETRDAMRWLWFPQLQKSVQAIIDLRSAELV